MSHTVYDGAGLQVGTFNGGSLRGPMVHIGIGLQYTEIPLTEWSKIVAGVEEIYPSGAPETASASAADVRKLARALRLLEQDLWSRVRDSREGWYSRQEEDEFAKIVLDLGATAT